MQVYVMEILSADLEQTPRVHGFTPYSNLAHRWAKEIGSTTITHGNRTTYYSDQDELSRRVTKVDEIEKWDMVK